MKPKKRYRKCRCEAILNAQGECPWKCPPASSVKHYVTDRTSRPRPGNVGRPKVYL